MNAFVDIKDVTKEYGTATALSGVTFAADRGVWCAIVGASGSGKSTMLNIIGGLDSPTSGCVAMNEVDLCALTEDQMARFRRENVGYVFQQSHLVPYLTSVENVMLAQYFHSLTDEAEVEQALKRVGMSHRLGHRPSELSGGEQQRVCIARALINNPRVLLADEPTGNLDRENTTLILELLRQLHTEEHFTIVMVTHDAFVAGWAERMVTMQDGLIVKDEPTDR